MDTLFNLETGYINWDEIKKLKDNFSEDNISSKKFYCKRCKKSFYSKNYEGDYPLCIEHRNNNTFKKK